MNQASAIAIAEVMREIAEFEAVDAAVARDLAQRKSASGAASRVFSVRLDSGEVAALERRAAALGLKPTGLARNLIRTGLSRRDHDALAAALSRLQAALDEVRALVP